MGLTSFLIFIILGSIWSLCPPWSPAHYPMVNNLGLPLLADCFTLIPQALTAQEAIILPEHVLLQEFPHDRPPSQDTDLLAVHREHLQPSPSPTQHPQLFPSIVSLPLTFPFSDTSSTWPLATLSKNRSFPSQFNVYLFWGWGGMPRGLWDLSSPTRDWTRDLAVKAPSPNHWTTREFPSFYY